jgi:hypothetical protein
MSALLVWWVVRVWMAQKPGMARRVAKAWMASLAFQEQSDEQVLRA